jgi:iron complex transport system ATP-binding protein
MQAESVIQLEHVHFTYEGYAEDACAVHDVTADLYAGRITAMVGPNAAGKSTLLKLMLGHLSSTQGRVVVMGSAIDTLSGIERALHLSYVPQRPAQMVAFTVRQIVELGRHAGGADSERVDKAMSWCELSALSSKLYKDLSIGQQQRVALARAIAQSCGVGGTKAAGAAMLLDEPVSAMDLKHIHQSMRILRSLADEGIAILVVLHDLNLASLYADDVWLMSQGQVVAAGAKRDVLTKAVLEPVYGVKLLELADAHTNGQVFQVDISGTIM